MQKLYRIFFILLLYPIYLSGTIYENAENGNTEGWRIYDYSGENPNISNEFDQEKNSFVIKLQGEGSKNAFILGDFFPQRKGWDNKTEHNLKWDMNFLQDFTIYIRINTTKGLKYLCYTPINMDLGSQSQNRYYHHGIGDDSKNGTWQTISRDLESDLKKFDPDNNLISVLGFLVRGNGKIDNIELNSQTKQEETIQISQQEPLNKSPEANAGDDITINLDDTVTINGSASDEDGVILNYKWNINNKQEPLALTKSFIFYAESKGVYELTFTVTDDDGAIATDTLNIIVKKPETRASIISQTLYEDSENGDTKGWRVYDTMGVNPSISNIYDSEKQSRVIRLSGEGEKNAYILGSFAGPTAWNNTTETVLEWAMKTSEIYTIYIRVNTSKGYRYLYYTPIDYNLGRKNQYIHHGIGENSHSGQWKFLSRNLSNDLKEYEPDNHLISVLGFLVRGNINVDDIYLYKHDDLSNQEPLETNETMPDSPDINNSTIKPSEDNNTLDGSIENNKFSKIQKLLYDASRNINQTVKYIISGDSTRALNGNEMLEYYQTQFSKINVNILNNAISGQTARGWISNRGSFTHQHAINLTNNLGENTILEYSLGINDSYRYDKTEIKNAIKQGIETYLKAKPQAKVLLVTPIVTSNTLGTAQLKEVYQELSNELNLPLIDAQIATQGVHGNTLYYREGIHPNRFGSRRILNYITNELLPNELHNQMTLTEHPDKSSSDWLSIDTINDGLDITLRKEN
ncbi:MAG TPA: hypothetical protein ENK66_10560 [Arcobacter sp.]|nr:hypothetical protein [Arcobacter sp.]